MDLRSTQLKDTYGNLVTIGSVAGSPTTGTLQNGQGADITALDVNGTITSDGLTVDGTATLGASSSDIFFADSFNSAIRTPASAGHFYIQTANGAKTLAQFEDNNDISFYNSTGTNQGLFWDASAGSLGLGTTSPTAPLTVQALETGGTVHLKGNTSDGSAIAFRDNAGTSNVSLIYTDSTQFRIDTVGSSPIIFKPAGSEAMRIENGGDISFRDTSNNEAFYWDASTARLGLGTTSPPTPLSVSYSTGSLPNANFVGFTLDRPSVTGNTISSFLALITGSGEGALIGGGADGFAVNTYDGTTSTERLRIDSSGNVGINAIPENSAGTWRNYRLGSLTMAGRATGTNPDAMFGTNFKFTTANAEQRISADPTSRIFFNDDVIIFQNAGSDTAGSTISWNERMRILSSGGITFNGDTASANALDDYEEGTWSPVYVPSSGSFTTMTMDVVSATYTKIGRQVTVRAYIRTDDVDDTGASGALLIEGLPFSSAGSNGGFSAISIGFSTAFSTTPDGGYINTGDTVIRLRKTSATTNSLITDLTTGTTGDRNQLMITATYFV